MEKKQNIISNQDTGYISFRDDKRVLGKHDIEKYDFVKQGGEKTIGLEVVRDTSVRPPFSRFDYDYFRPYEITPKVFPQLVKACRTVYQRIGVVRSVFDMMTDFAIEGMKLIHPDKDVETFYRIWARKVKLNDAVDEFVRHLLVDGNVVVKRVTGTLTKPTETQWSEDTKAKSDHTIKKDPAIHDSREIPIRYIFLNVVCLLFIGGDPARLAGERSLMFQLSQKVQSMILNPQGPSEQAIVEKLPKDLRETVVKGNGNLIPLDMQKIYIAHHKKDSWDDWAPPFLGAVLSDIFFKDKLRLADTAALDGIINVIRLWKLGDHTKDILPTDAAVQKLISILSNNTGGGAIDLVWDTMIDMKADYPPIDKILGAEKYDKIDRDILIGLGVPEVLVGGKGGNFSNSYIQLKTLIEKLQYVRNRVQDWLFEELNIVAKTMVFETAARVKFDDLSLQDENTIRKLVISLWDRNIISSEAVLTAFGEDFVFEVEKIKKEQELFKKSNIETKSPLDQKPQGPTPVGRPVKTNDSSKRKERTPKPKIKGINRDLTLFAMDAIDAIDQYVIPSYMEKIDVDNARKLTNQQKEEINQVRSVALACININDDISKDNILNIIQTDKVNINVVAQINENIQKFTEQHGNLPTLKQRKNIEAISWAEIFENVN